MRASLRAVPALFAVVTLACGAQTPPQGQRTVSDCERMVRHAIAVDGTTTDPDAIRAAVGARCADPGTLAWLNSLPDWDYACLLRARSVDEGNLCHSAPQPATEWPPVVPGSVCPAYAGTRDKAATVRGVVTYKGAPFIGATLNAYPRIEGPEPAFAASTISECEGDYAFEGLAPDTHHLVVYIGERAIVVPCVEAVAHETVVDIKLPRDLWDHPVRLD